MENSVDLKKPVVLDLHCFRKRFSKWDKGQALLPQGHTFLLFVTPVLPVAGCDIPVQISLCPSVPLKRVGTFRQQITLKWFPLWQL